MSGAPGSDPAPPPGYGSRSLADLLPSLAAGIGVPGFSDVLGLGESASALMVLVDGLGASLVAEHSDDAPTLAAMVAGRSLDAGFPASTSISVASLGTGLPPGAHGLVGITMNVGGRVLDTLKWTVEGRDASEVAVPEQIQTHDTVFERIRAAGRRPVVVSNHLFRNSSLTRAALRGADYLGVAAHGDLAALALDAVGTPGTLAYAYLSELDTVGHLHGPGSPAWRLQLREVDHLIGMLVDGLPSDVLLTVTGDHGMVAMTGRVVDYDDEPTLRDGVDLLAGEPRVRYVHVRSGALDDVRATWTDVLGEGFWIGTREQIVDSGALGTDVPTQIAERIGDLVVVATSNGGVVRRRAEPVLSGLIGQHGSWTDAERLVALGKHRG
jgi:hypothetical protein